MQTGREALRANADLEDACENLQQFEKRKGLVAVALSRRLHPTFNVFDDDHLPGPGQVDEGPLPGPVQDDDERGVAPANTDDDDCVQVNNPGPVAPALPLGAPSVLIAQQCNRLPQLVQQHDAQGNAPYGLANYPTDEEKMHTGRRSKVTIEHNDENNGDGMSGQMQKGQESGIAVTHVNKSEMSRLTRCLLRVGSLVSCSLRVQCDNGA